MIEVDVRSARCDDSFASAGGPDARGLAIRPRAERFRWRWPGGGRRLRWGSSPARGKCRHDRPADVRANILPGLGAWPANLAV